MNYGDWEPIYREILGEFGYSREADRESARLLDGYLDAFDESRLNQLFDGKDIVVAGDGPDLLTEWKSEYGECVVVAADAACRRLADDGVAVDVVCTDLDGAPERAAQLSHGDVIVVVHAHGDNQELVEHWIGGGEYDLTNVVGTTQTEPFGTLHNYGGFTDGDRAAYLADEYGAASIDLVGFDFTDQSVSEEKARKLEWAKRLLERLGEERGERLVLTS